MKMLSPPTTTSFSKVYKCNEKPETVEYTLKLPSCITLTTSDENKCWWCGVAVTRFIR